MDNQAVRISGLRKSYAGVSILKGIDIAFERGKIHALVGANGAGKSTFLSCLSGAVTPDAGTIVIDGRTVSKLTPRLAREYGIGIIYQHFQAAEGLTVADNIFLSSELKRHGMVDRSRQEAITRELLAGLGSDIDPASPLERLSMGERQIVEIARAIRVKPHLLILDEPTAALGEREIEALHQVTRRLARNDNIAVVYVTHLLDEVPAIGDAVTVLRDGRVVWTRDIADVAQSDIVEAIAPRAIVHVRAPRTQAETGEGFLQLEDFRSPYTGPIDLSVMRGEIIGIYGLLGSGRTDLLECLAGARPMSGGRVLLDAVPVDIRSPSKALAAGIALVASDRVEQSLFGDLSARDNLLMPHFQSLSRIGGRNIPEETRVFDEMARNLGVRPLNAELAGNRFSGGNAQKIMIGRWLAPGCDISVLLLDEPMQGVDVGARADIFRLIDAFAAQGKCVMVSSSDPAEIVALSDRVLILGQGRQLALIDGKPTETDLIEISHRSAMGWRADDPARRVA